MITKNKYQFFISYQNNVRASAASKPISDTSKTLSALGYTDYSISFKKNSKTFKYYITVFLRFASFIVRLKNGSIVATQYPIPTVGYLLNVFSGLLSLKKLTLITVIHDINTLRLLKPNDGEVRKEMKMLGAYHGLIVHNDIMKDWLIKNGLKSSIKIVSLELFDYISTIKNVNTDSQINKEIAFAGHLAKSLFVYNLDNIKNWKFNIYGSEFNAEKNKNRNTSWKGEFSPDEIVHHLEGSFGLIWDGVDSNHIETNTFGNYMRYNNPFKFSLYIAAGLPVIAPKTAAVAGKIIDNKIGFLISKLEDLDNIEITAEQYGVMKANVKKMQKDIVAGNYLKSAVHKLEKQIAGE